MRGARPAAVQETWDASAWAAAHVGASATPAFVARADGTIILANDAVKPLLSRGELPSGLRALIIDTRFKNCVQAAKVPLSGRDDNAPRCYELALIPLPAGEVFGVGRDGTFEANLLSALSASRDLFRDLALGFSDFAFETDASGAFSWTSPGGLLGYSAAELHGVRPHDLFDAAEVTPFSARTRVNGREVWVKSKVGGESCIALTVAPLFDQRGAWCGARGVVRDVTTLRVLERETLQARKREDLINAIVGAVRAQVEPRRMLLAAADALAAATDADAVTIRVLGSDSTIRVGEKQLGLANAVELTTSYRETPNGSLRLARRADRSAFGEADRALLDAVLPHLGVALTLVQTLEASGVSSHDGATGLLTRRAFFAQARRKYATAARAGRELMLIVFDCDDLEDLIGAGGAGANEDALAAIGRALSARCSSDDAVGRYEDDAFILATDWAANPLEAAEAVRAELAAAARRLCPGVAISAGCAVAHADGDETLEDLIARAECALHTAKREGRNRVALAETSS